MGDRTNRRCEWYARNNSDLHVDETEKFIKKVIGASMYEDMSSNESFEKCTQVEVFLQNMQLFYRNPRKGASTYYFCKWYSHSTLNPYAQAIMGVVFMKYLKEHIMLYGDDDLFSNEHIVTDLKTEWSNMVHEIDETTPNEQTFLKKIVDMFKQTYYELRKEMRLYDFKERLEDKQKELNVYKQELIEKTWHPSRMIKWCLDVDEQKEWVDLIIPTPEATTTLTPLK